MKRKNILITCLILFGSAFVALQVHWNLFARAPLARPSGSLIEAIRRGDFALSAERRPVYMGDADVRKRLRIPTEDMLTEQQFNANFSEDKRRAYERGYAATPGLRFGQQLLEVNEPEQIVDAVEAASAEEPLSVVEQPIYPPTPPPLPLRPGKKQPVVEEIMPPSEKQVVSEDEQSVTANTQPIDLFEQIRQGIPLKHVEREEQAKPKTLQDEIKEGIKLRPASERKLPEREKELTLQDEVKQGIKLKPAHERELKPKPAKPVTLLDEIRQFDKTELKPLGEQTEQFETEAVSTIPLAPPLPPRLPAIEQSPNLLEQIRGGYPLRPVDERETTPAPVGLSEQDALKQALREKFSGSEGEEEEDMTPEDMGFIPPAPSIDGMIQPEHRPESNQGLLEQIRAGKQLKPVSQSPRPAPESQDSAQKSLEKKILQYQQTVPETDESEYTESDWE